MCSSKACLRLPFCCFGEDCRADEVQHYHALSGDKLKLPCGGEETQLNAEEMSVLKIVNSFLFDHRVNSYGIKIQ